MKPIYKKYVTSIAMIWAACLVLGLFAYMLLVNPQQKARHRIERQLAKKKAEFEQAIDATKPENREKTRRLLNNLGQRLDEFTVPAADSAALTLNISRLAKDNELDAFSVRGKNGLDKSGENARLTESQITLTFNSSFTQFAAFLNTLERNNPILFVDSLLILRSPDSSHQVEMDIAALIRKPKADS